MTLFYKLYKDQVLQDGRYRQIQVFSNLWGREGWKRVKIEATNSNDSIESIC